MTVIAPTILTETTDEYKKYVERIHPFAQRVHIDISDGDFAPTVTIDKNQVWWPEEWLIDVHAMVRRPSDHIETLIKLKPHLVIFHVEAEGDILDCLKQLKRAGIKSGIALLRSTVPSAVAPLIEEADHIMIFSGELGKNGGHASMMQLEKVRLVKQINQAVEIGWDGGVNIENAFTLAQGGVDVLNVGGELSRSKDPRATYDTLVKEINKHGVI